MTRPRVRACVAFAVFVIAGLVPIGASSPRGRVAPRPGPTATAPSAPLLDILQAELKRNVDVLRNQPVPPYYVSYVVYDTQSSQLDSSFGAVVADVDNHSRTFGVDVRTGDYALDNTHEIRGEPAPPAALGRAVIPLTDSAPAIDVAAWQATDRAYRQSVERLARVKTNLAAKVKEEDPAPDFSREDPQVFVGTAGLCTRWTRPRGRPGCAGSRRCSPTTRSSCRAKPRSASKPPRATWSAPRAAAC